jgi:RimJ/RimL family protein N-acetyltransferase
MEVEIVPLQKEHIFELMAGDLTEGTLIKDPEMVQSAADAYMSSGPAFSAFYDGTLVACCGILIIWKGVGTAWVLFKKEAAEVHELRKAAYEKVTQYMVFLINDLQLHRVQAHCCSETPDAVRYLEGLGFEREGVMKKYGMDKSDYYLYAMTFER